MPADEGPAQDAPAPTPRVLSTARVRRCPHDR